MGTSNIVGIVEGHGGVQQPCQEMLKPDFTIDPVTVVFGNSITYTDQSEGDVVSWEWTFEGGDPATSTDTIVNVLYNTVGIYGVTLTVSDGTDVLSKVETIYVVEPGAPVPHFQTTDSTTIMAGTSISFVDLTTGNPENWRWTFQGGDPVTDTINQHPQNITYNIPGTYNVYLTTSNVWGTSYHTEYGYITVLAEEPPVEVCDTITNLDIMDALVVHEPIQGGLIPGINGLDISEYAEEFDNTQINYSQINGIRVWVDTTLGASPNSLVRFKVWEDAVDGGPDTLLAYKDVAIENMSAGPYGYVYAIYFDDPVDISGLDRYYIGFKISPVGTDQFAVSMADDRGPSGFSSMFMLYQGNWFRSENLAVAGGWHTSMGIEPIACEPTSVHEFAYEKDNIDIFPNPTNDKINISFGQKLSKNYLIKVYNTMGKEVQVNMTSNGDFSSQIDFINNKNGIYFITMQKGQKVVTRKVVLNR